jgi:hypothetical protein
MYYLPITGRRLVLQASVTERYSRSRLQQRSAPPIRHLSIGSTAKVVLLLAFVALTLILGTATVWVGIH